MAQADGSIDGGTGKTVAAHGSSGATRRFQEFPVPRRDAGGFPITATWLRVQPTEKGGEHLKKD